MKKTVSGIVLTLLTLSVLTAAFNGLFVKAVADPIISGTVRDKKGTLIPDVLIVAQDASTGIEVASATSNATGAYAMTVPPSIYNLIVKPPPESGFANTTIPNIQVTTDVVIDIVLTPAEIVTFSGKVVDRDNNPVPNQRVILSSAAVHEKEDLTDEQGMFSIQVPPDYYGLVLYAGGYAPNVPSWFWLGKGINLTQDTFVTFILQNRYLSGMVIDPNGNPVSSVSIDVWGDTTFNGFNGRFESWTTSDNQGNFILPVFICPSVTLKATPPADSPFGPVLLTNINVTEDASVVVTLAPLITFSGKLLDRDGNPVPNQRVILSSAAVHEKEDTTDDQGLFSIQVPPDYYGLVLYAGGYAPNVPSWFWLGKGINLTQDTFVTFTLQNRYLSGKVVDPNGNPVSSVSIDVWGDTTFNGFNGRFESWTTSDNQGSFNVTIFTSSCVSLKATPPESSRFGPVFITGVNVTEDKTIVIALVYKPGLPPIADFTWSPAIPKVGELVTFNASASTPDGGEIVSYEWDFGDGQHASGKIVTHIYTSAGNFTVTLNVTDSEGFWDIEQKHILVEAPPTPPVITATIDIDPKALNLRSKGKWITCYIELPEGFEVAEINRTSILLNDTIHVDPFWLNKTIESVVGDYDGDGIADLMVKFNRAEVTYYILTNVDITKLIEERFMTITLTVTGKLNDGTPFKGSATIKIIMPMPRGLYRIFYI